jgi:hypothetical protein
LNILAECRSALAYVEGRPRNRKTATGMPAYLTSWLTRSVNTPRMRAKPDEAPAAPRSSRQADRMTEIEEALK